MSLATHEAAKSRGVVAMLVAAGLTAGMLLGLLAGATFSHRASQPISEISMSVSER
jgi:hypothetical protein